MHFTLQFFETKAYQALDAIARTDATYAVALLFLWQHDKCDVSKRDPENAVRSVIGDVNKVVLIDRDANGIQNF